MPLSLTGKTALVTGSTNGIGRGIARALAQEGCDLMLNGFGDAAEIDRLRASLAGANRGRVGYHGADLSKPAEIAALIEHTMDTLGRIDILVNNAGLQHVSPIETFPVEQWDRLVAVNLSACFHTTRAALPGMRARNWGRIINIASVHGLVSSPNKSAYAATKHGVVGLTKTVALETATTGVTCNAICPGWVRTPLAEAQIRARAREDGTSIEAAVERLLEKQPSKAFVTPEEIGALVLYLCSDAAAQFRGAALTMDGGWTAQ